MASESVANITISDQLSVDGGTFLAPVNTKGALLVGNGTEQQ